VLADANGGSEWVPIMNATASAGIRRVIETLQAQGVRSVRAAMSRPGLRKWLDPLRVLAQMGGRPPRGVVGGSVELLQGDDFACLVGIGIEIGALLDFTKWS
jgi:hypothetical protein